MTTTIRVSDETKKTFDATYDHMVINKKIPVGSNLEAAFTYLLNLYNDIYISENLKVTPK